MRYLSRDKLNEKKFELVDGGRGRGHKHAPLTSHKSSHAIRQSNSVSLVSYPIPTKSTALSWIDVLFPNCTLLQCLIGDVYYYLDDIGNQVLVDTGSTCENCDKPADYHSNLILCEVCNDV